MSRFAFAPQAACLRGRDRVVGCEWRFSVRPGGPRRIPGSSSMCSQVAPEIDAKFRPQEGWIGGDGAQSIDLGNNRTLWLFNDTLGRRRERWTSLAGADHSQLRWHSVRARCALHIHRPRGRSEEAGRSASRPADGRGWLWFQNGMMVKDRLYLFLSQFDIPTDALRPRWTPLGQWLAVVENPQDDPRDWCVDAGADAVQLLFTPSGRDVWKRSGCRREVPVCVRQRRSTRLLSQNRVSDGRPRSARQDRRICRSGRFLRKGRWSRDFMDADQISDYMSSDLSVAYMPELKKYLMVYTDCDVSQPDRGTDRSVTDRTVVRIPRRLHTCRDAYGDQRAVLLRRKGPSEPVIGRQAGDQLPDVVSRHLAGGDGCRLFWPTFVTVGMGAKCIRGPRRWRVSTGRRGRRPSEPKSAQRPGTGASSGRYWTCIIAGEASCSGSIRRSRTPVRPVSARDERRVSAACSARSFLRRGLPSDRRFVGRSAEDCSRTGLDSSG